MADAKDSPPPAPLKEELVVTEHRLTLPNRALDYSVTCGTLVLRED